MLKSVLIYPYLDRVTGLQSSPQLTRLLLYFVLNNWSNG
ncbi:hypothetical protein AVDCRST_MAG81-875 [uncultured Synechococcales cyanobacterium]|uniref:Uncharacterized protein n=1 Tax=uncultured Synechococcales cyanobacterium TaxID=1936017 RepID=A0A6J4UXC9_9CYAN|nr:hypothetical protein AVDCRST_MAG81-875 [uncultured Synechococcales cyanobacterium]